MAGIGSVASYSSPWSALGGGTQVAAVPAGAATTLIKNAPGVVARIHVLTAGTASTNFLSGANVLYSTPPTVSVGQYLGEIMLPFGVNISAVGVAGSPQLTVSFV